MALARFASRNDFRRVLYLSDLGRGMANSRQDRWSEGILRHFSTSAAPESGAKSGDQEIAVSEGPQRSSSSLRKRRGRLNRGRDLVPFGLNDLFAPFGFATRLQLATENINRLFNNVAPFLFSSNLDFYGNMREDDKSYKLRYEMPGLSKEDIKITVEDGCLLIRGEHKEEKRSGSDEEDEWSSRRYGYYSNSLVLPDDAKVDEIKAELKHGVLYVTVPKSETQKKDVKLVEVQ